MCICACRKFHSQWRWTIQHPCLRPVRIIWRTACFYFEWTSCKGHTGSYIYIIYLNYIRWREKYTGLYAQKAREEVVKDLEKKGLIKKHGDKKSSRYTIWISQSIFRRHFCKKLRRSKFFRKTLLNNLCAAEEKEVKKWTKHPPWFFCGICRQA